MTKPKLYTKSEVDEIRHLSAITIRDFAKQYSDMEKIKDYEIQQLRAKLKEQEETKNEVIDYWKNRYYKLERRVGKE